MDLGIKGKKAIVCASSKGLGLGCALSLAEAGVDLIINSRNPQNLESAASLLKSHYVDKCVRFRDSAFHIV